MLVDSHCHLNFPEFENDLGKVIQNALCQGVQYFLTVNTRLNEAETLQKIADRYSFIWCSVGVHPHDAQHYSPVNLREEIKKLCQHPKVIALGETGLDYHYNNSPRKEQIESFEAHLQSSLDLDLPVIIHTREADADTLHCLKNFPGVKGVFHCFTGSYEMAKAGLDLGLYISFSGIITFKKAEDLREVVGKVPLSSLLVETDSPFLAPLPHRGERNEPAYVRLVAEKVSEIHGCSFEELCQKTTQNFFNLFHKAKVEKN